MKYSKKRVAIVIPIYKTALSEDDGISLRHLDQYLVNYEKIFFAPVGLIPPRSDYRIEYFKSSYFQNTATYSKLMMSCEFYERFLPYEYILIYQLDCLVFSDQLEEWCSKGFDYIGAPWINASWIISEGFRHCEQTGVGNGGFSLRKVESHLQTLRIYYNFPNRFVFFFRKKILFLKMLSFPYNFFAGIRHILREKRFLGIKEIAQQKIAKLAQTADKHFSVEDVFWSFEAPQINKAFRIPDASIAVQFAFESRPEVCLQRNANRLPFGCHGWVQYKNFWSKYYSNL